MKVLFLPKYDQKAASCRYRFLQYLPYLEEHGVRCTVSPLFDDAYLENKFALGRARTADVLRAFLRRTWAILGSKRFDLVVLHVEAFPYLPPFFELALKLFGVKYIYDYDDAIFHNYDLHRNRFVRTLLAGKIATAISCARKVIAGNGYLARYAGMINPDVVILPTVVDVEKYQPVPPSPPEAGRKFTIGWIGSPSTSEYLRCIASALKALCADGNCKVALVGAGEMELPGVDLETIPWSESTEVSAIQGFDVGIMPLPDEPWARGKCGFKLIQYMACGIPVIASPVGVNTDIVQHGKNGFLASAPDDWARALRALRDDVELRRKLGKAGRQIAERNYSLQWAAPKLLSILKGTAR